jgi:hypothetical protein
MKLKNANGKVLFPDDIDFSVNLLCTMQFRNGIEQYIDSMDEMDDWLDEIRKDIESVVTNWNARIAYAYNDRIPEFAQTPVILSECNVVWDSGVKNDSVAFEMYPSCDSA